MIISLLKPAKNIYFLLLDRFIKIFPSIYRLFEKLRIFIMYYKIDKSLRFLCSNTRPGDVVYDIGAHIGLYSICLVNRVKKTKIFAFEPQPNIYQRLREKIWLFRYNESIVPLEYALGTNVGSASFYISSNPGRSSFHKYNAARGSKIINTIKINCYTIDYLVEHQIIDAPDIMKIDAEGSELKVINGAKNTILKYHPRILLEPHDTEDLYTVEEIERLLSGFNYRYIRNDYLIYFY